ncbi:hypothetical protein NGM37_17385, partial [Streptomyces sp. TRM76130]|nr:hypothetical protein [Streptomyces sp. TRM76130]
APTGTGAVPAAPADGTAVPVGPAVDPALAAQIDDAAAAVDRLSAELDDVRERSAQDRTTLRLAGNTLARDQTALEQARARRPELRTTALGLRSAADTARGHADAAASVQQDTQESHDRA